MSSSSTNRRKTLAALFLVFTLAIPFAMVYYVSTDSYKARYQQWRKSADEAGRPIRSKQAADQFILARDEKLEINNISLEYKGIMRKNLMINLYLLDFDPQQPYLVEIPRKQAKDGFTIADHQFLLISGNDRFINLKLLDSFQTP
jgi:hypothetical protein